MKSIFLVFTLFYSLSSLSGGIDGCKQCATCVVPAEKRICLNTCGPNQLPSIRCQQAPTNTFLLLGQQGPPFYCVISSRGFWCDSEECSKCIPARR